MVTRALSSGILKRAGVRDSDGARTAMMTFVQHFGSKLNLNVHLHILALNGAYTFEHGKARFHRAPAPRPHELDALLSTLITRITRTLVRGGALNSEGEQPYLDFDLDSPREQLDSAAIRYVIASGPEAGQGVGGMTASRQGWLELNKSIAGLHRPTRRSRTAAAGAFAEVSRTVYSGHPALRPSGQLSAAQNRSERFCVTQCPQAPSHR